MNLCAKQKSKEMKNARYTRSKNPKFKNIHEAFRKIIPFVQSSHFHDGDLLFVNKVFCFFFHPETPDQHRKPMIEQFFKLLTALTPEQISDLQEAIALIIPYTHFVQPNSGDEEVFNAELFQGKGLQPLVDASHKIGDQSTCIEDLNSFLNFIVANWDTMNDFCTHSLNYHILNVIYKKYTDKYSEKPSLPRYGFTSGPPEQLHDTIITFLKNMSTVNKEHNWTSFFKNEYNCRLILDIAREVFSHQKPDDFVTMLQYFSFIMSNPEYLSTFLSSKDDILLDVINIFKDYYPIIDTNKHDSIGDMENFILIWFDTLICNTTNEITLRLLYEIFSDNKNDDDVQLTTKGFILINFLHYLFQKHFWKEEFWSSFTTFLIQNEFLTSVISRYSQYLALYIFPYIFSINPSIYKEVTTSHVTRKKRTKQETPYDYMAENAEIIYNNPTLFAQENVTSFYDDFKKFDPILTKLHIIPLSDNINSQYNDVLNFLKVFNFYSQCETEELQLRAFSPIISFSKMIVELRMLPPGILTEITIPFTLLSNILFNAILLQSNLKIRQMSFDILSSIINIYEMIQYLSFDDFINWYAALIMMMMSIDNKDKQFGLQQAVITIQNEFIGSPILYPIIMALCEDNIFEINQSYISFVSSLPLFDIDVKPIKQFIDTLKVKMNKYSKLYIQNFEKYFEKDHHNLRKRAINLIENLQQTKKWNLILPAYISLISEEFSRPIQDSKLISKMLLNLIEPLNDEEYYCSISSIRSILMYFPKLEKLIPNEYLQFISSLTDITINLNLENLSKSFDLIKLTTEVYIESFSLVKINESYHKFATFLISSVKNKKCSNEIKTLLSNMIDLLATYYGKYPFPQTSSFPTYQKTTIDEHQHNPLFITTKTIIDPTYINEDTVQISSQTQSGHFIWNFKEIDKDFFDENKLDNIELPITDNKDEKIEPSINLNEEKSFVDVFDSLLNEYESYFKDEEFPLDQFPSHENINNSINLINEQFNKSNIKNNQNQTPKYPKPIPNSTNLIAGALTVCGRYPLNHPGNMSIVDPKKDNNINALLQKIHKMNHRLGIKIGVVYINQQAQNQNDILSTTFENTSLNFQEFLNGLGWLIDLSTHQGFDGGLSTKNGSIGESSIYYSDFMFEVMFHVAPLLPTTNDDPQQLAKKRHIGNDHIHIIWSEQNKDYDITTITSQFNKAYIIIYPLKCGLYRVDIKWKDELDCYFGPLRYQIITNKKELPSLVRATAIEAMLAFYRTKDATKFSYPQNDIVNSFNEIYLMRIGGGRGERKDPFLPLQSMMKITPSNDKNEKEEINENK